MKPVIVFDGRPAQGNLRGIGIYTQRLLPALVAAAPEFDIQVALDRRLGEDPWADLNSVVRLVGVGGNPVIWEQQVLPGLAKKAGARLLHCTANSSPVRCSIPMIVTIHDAMFMRGLGRISDRLYFRQLAAYLYYRFAVKPGAKRCARILTVSEYSRQEIVRRLGVPAEKISVAQLGCPHAMPSASEAQIQKILAQYGITRPYLLGLGAIDNRKNTANLVRAFARLPRSAVTMLVLAGFEKSEHSMVPELIKSLKQTERIRILGFVPEVHLNALFQASAAFAYPTREEGFGLPVIQAFHLGVPVITSRRGAIPEIAGKAVRYADPEDPCNISNEILAVLIDPDEAHHNALAGYIQAKQFTWEKTAALTAEAYRMVLSSNLA